MRKECVCNGCGISLKRCSGKISYCSILCQVFSRVEVGHDNNCWHFTGTTSDRGYGLIKVQGVYRKVHRVVYELLYETIPYGMCLCHTCDIYVPKGSRAYRVCCNPKHMFVGTVQDNNRDMFLKQRNVLPPKATCNSHRV